MELNLEEDDIKLILQIIEKRLLILGPTVSMDDKRIHTRLVRIKNECKFTLK